MNSVPRACPFRVVLLNNGAYLRYACARFLIVIVEYMTLTVSKGYICCIFVFIEVNDCDTKVVTDSAVVLTIDSKSTQSDEGLVLSDSSLDNIKLKLR